MPIILYNLQFYIFYRCLLWVEACNNHKLAGISTDILYNKYCICEKHFQQWCFMNSTNKKRLMHNAIPNKAIPDQLNENAALNTQLCNDDDENELLSVVQSGENIQMKRSEMFFQVKLLKMSQEHSLSTCTQCAQLEIYKQKTIVNICETPKLTQKSFRRRYTLIRKKMALALKRTKDGMRKMKNIYAHIRAKLHFYKKIRQDTLKKSLLDEGIDGKLVNFILRQIKLNKCKGKKQVLY